VEDGGLLVLWFTGRESSLRVDSEEGRKMARLVIRQEGRLVGRTTALEKGRVLECQDKFSSPVGRGGGGKQKREEGEKKGAGTRWDDGGTREKRYQFLISGAVGVTGREKGE